MPYKISEYYTPQISTSSMLFRPEGGLRPHPPSTLAHLLRPALSKLLIVVPPAKAYSICLSSSLRQPYAVDSSLIAGIILYPETAALLMKITLKGKKISLAENEIPKKGYNAVPEVGHQITAQIS